MVIFVPKKGEEFPERIASIQPGEDEGKGDKININTADSNSLQTLPGIGPQKAEAIIQFREQEGPFQAVEDLMKVSGIGEKTFEKLKDLITVK